MRHAHRCAVVALALGATACLESPDTGLVTQDVEGVTVCHRSPGGSPHGQTLTVSAQAAAAHVGHGDALGACGSGCEPGSVRACYGGPDGTEGVGTCAAGTETCDETGAYGPCTGEIGPAAEVCGDGLDTDCDGSADGGCVGGRAWLDRDSDGLQDGGEGPLAGIQFTLRALDGTLIAATTSDVSGRYAFGDVAAGTYVVDVAWTGFLFLSPPDIGADDTLDSDFDPETLTSNPFVFTGAPFTHLDCGLNDLIED